MKPEIAELVAEAKLGKTRFESLALRRAIDARVAAGELVQAIAGDPADAYLVMEALRALDAAAWNAVDEHTRVTAYVGALARARSYDDWGFPGLARGEVGPVLVGFGAAAVAPLAPLLGDPRAAPLAGSQESTMSRVLQNRVCDYALYYIALIRGEAFSYPEDPAARDQMIVALRERLGRS